MNKTKYEDVKFPPKYNDSQKLHRLRSFTIILLQEIRLVYMWQLSVCRYAWLPCL